MKIPRDLTGVELAKALHPWGDEIVRQTGSHLRLTRRMHVEQHLTIPRIPH
jgi:predicted RNA binding protein YcfA (HicA-like mRNA interferase family)